MHNGEPFISSQTIHAALEDLLYNTAARDKIQPLYCLALVEEEIQNPDRPSVENFYEYTLKRILISVVTNEYQIRRAAHHFSFPDTSSPRTIHLQMIAEDARSEDRTLLGVSWLYHHYIDVNVSIDNDLFCQHANIDQRTLRRYQQHAIILLRDRLASLERDARKRRHKQRLLLSLPQPALDRPVFNQVDPQLVEKILATPSHIYVTGEYGLGKTYFLHRCAQQLIQQDKIQHLVWIDRPLSVEMVQQWIAEEFASEGFSIDLREYLLNYPTAIVLDDADQLLINSTEVADLLNKFGVAYVLFASQTYIVKAPQPLYHIALKPLSPEQTLAYAAQYTEEAQDWDQDLVWNITKGNPHWIYLYSQHPDLINLSLRERFDAFDHTHQVLWAALALLPEGHYTLDVLNKMFKASFTGKHFLTLDYYQIAKTETPSINLYPQARDYIEIAHKKHKRVQSIIDSLLNDIERSLPEHPLLMLPVVEHLLTNENFTIDPKRSKAWVELLLPYAMEQRRCTIWIHILKQHLSLHQPNFALSYGVLLRRIGDWDLADRIFEQTIRQAGAAGNFALQSSAGIELAILCRYRGEYRRAQGLILQAEQAAQRYQNVQIQQRALIERAQIAIDEKKGEAVLHLLKDLPETIATLLMRSEAYLLLADWENCHALALHAEKTCMGDMATLGRVYTVLGRCAAGQNRHEQAQAYFAQAMTLLEQTDDPFALARAQSNYAALMLQQNETPEEAERLLDAASSAQQKLKDKAGLLFTQHNLRLLREYRIQTLDSNRR
jgi:hypothetical protein